MLQHQACGRQLDKASGEVQAQVSLVPPAAGSCRKQVEGPCAMLAHLLHTHSNPTRHLCCPCCPQLLAVLNCLQDGRLRVEIPC